MTQIKSHIPKIRFKEFSGEWEEKKINQINLEVIDGDRGENYPNGNDFSSDGYCLFMNAKNVTNGGFVFNEKSFITKEKDEQLNKGKLKRGDLVLTTRGTIGNFAYYNEKINFDNLRINSGMVILRNNNKNLLSNYIYKYFDFNGLKKQISRISFGSAQPQLTVKDIKSLKISFPSLPEQQKIASFLSSVDEKIEKIKEKKKSLEEYKKGVMQKIFSQEIRFKSENGKEFGEWEEINFNKIIEKIGTGLNPRKNFVLGNGNNYYVTIKNISNGKLDFSSCEKIDDIALQKIHNRSQIQKNDLIMSSIGNIGESFLIESTPYNWDINESVFMIRGNNKVLPKFLYYIVTNNNSKKYFDNNSTGSSFKSIKLNSLKIMPINLPTLKEQEKIADFLSGIDEKIEKVSDELGKMEEFKKGLLQGMFV